MSPEVKRDPELSWPKERKVSSTENNHKRQQNEARSTLDTSKGSAGGADRRKEKRLKDKNKRRKSTGVRPR